MVYCDNEPNVLEWSSEEVVIPYISPVDGKYHRYFPDFKIKIKTKSGQVKTHLIEVKPLAQTVPPVKKSRITPKYITEVTTWGVNQAKWKAAEEFCDLQGWEFTKMTEKELGIT